MKLYSSNEQYKLYQGSMLDMLEVIESNTIDSIVTDPPYELNFMNKGWDNSGIAFQSDTWKKCYEVLKPGGYLLAFGGSRTFHRIACAIEDAGFEVRDTIMWLYGSGFPKSMALDKALEAKLTTGSGNKTGFRKLNGKLVDRGDYGYAKMQNEQGNRPIDYNKIEEKRLDKLEATTDLAKKYEGWGTALKPSFEPIIVARKPFKSSLVDNVIEYGVGGINIDECRVPAKQGEYDIRHYTNEDCFQNLKPKKSKFQVKTQPDGRFPANIILTYDETDFDEVCGGFPNTKSKGSNANYEKTNQDNPTHLYTNIKSGVHFEDSGSASRYFYTSKASKKDRDEGCQDLEDTFNACSNQAIAELKRGNDTFSDETNSTFNKVYKGKNTHPTVKPTELMQYLVRLVSPNGATILDCFNGSGSTGKAVMYENKERNKDYKYIGIELTEEYLPISKARIEYVCNQQKIEEEKIEQENKESGQLTIFDFIDSKGE